jgi:hypothetical protein
MPAPAGTVKNWALYRSRFVEPMRIRAGVAFWRANEKWRKLAVELYGVPPEIVAGIIGVETIYGQQMDNFRVIGAIGMPQFMPSRFNVAVPVNAAHRAVLLAPDIVPSFTRVEFVERGAPLDTAVPATEARLAEGDFVDEKMIRRVLNGARQQPGFKVHREEARAGVDLLVAGHPAPAI